MKKMNTIAGAAITKPPANLNVMIDWSSAVRTCAGKVRSRSVRMVAANTSFQEITNVKDRRRGEAGDRERKSDSQERRPAGAAERLRGLLELVRDADEHPAGDDD